MQQVDSGKLDGIKLLSSLNAKAFRSLEKTCTWRRYDANEQIVDRSSSSRDVLFVVEGRVHVVNYSLSGREIAYATVSAGGYFGELSAIDGEPRSATVVALERCLLAGITPELFNDLLLPHADIAIEVMRGLARIIRICDDRIMDLSTLGAVQRVYLELLRRAKPDPVTAGSWIIYPMPTQTLIAGRASTTRETVARVLSQLSQAGLVGRKGKTLHIRDRDRLEILAERLTQGDQEVAR